MAATHLSPCLLAAALLLAACGVEEIGDPPAAPRLTQVTGFGSNPGGLAMYLHAPADVGSGAPLVVALHGCMMRASDYEATGWSALADERKFFVVYPETIASTGCFRWYAPGDSSRGAGQALSIRQMVDYMVERHAVDPARIFVTGLSAGGAMSVSMLAAYPELFAAGAPMAGVPHRCADSVYDSTYCMNPGRSRSAEEWGALVRGAYPGYAGPYPRISLWHGTADQTVAPANLAALAAQWTAVHGLDSVEDSSERVAGATHVRHLDGAGRALVETWAVEGMGHGTAVDPAAGCGRSGGFVLDAGLCSTGHAARFFGLLP